MSVTLQHIELPLTPFVLKVDLALSGRITALFGPSGSGKTSLLDLIAGLRKGASASIRIGDQVVEDTTLSISVPSRHRGIGYVPQDLALFPHMSVRGNLLFGHVLSQSSSSEPDVFSFRSIVDLLELQSLLDRPVNGLSGGERQRVAFGRALLTRPRLLLLDEPMASLDRNLKMRVMPFLGRIRDELKIPMIYVTHDRFETRTLTDEMVVMVQGRAVQQGRTEEVFQNPVSSEVAGLLAVEYESQQE